MRIDYSHSSRCFNDRKTYADMIVLHYTDTTTIGESLELLSGLNAEVSAHYLIAEDGLIYRLVNERHRAWHAGISSWEGYTDVNSRSIGIELQNPGHSHGYRPFPNTQLTALVSLCHRIMIKHAVATFRVVAHSDIAPTRKKDPGELFPWEKMAQKGIGEWTNDFAAPVLPVSEMLKGIGYDIKDEQAALTAFRRHFYPQALLTPDAPDKTVERLTAVYELFTKKNGYDP